MKILITGGHFSPAYAIIQELQKRECEVVIIGRKHPFEGDRRSLSYEYKVSTELHIPFIELKTGRLQRKFTKHTLPGMIKFSRGILNARRIIHETQPDIVLTFGGYIALPIALAARTLKIPVVTHEQTQGFGLSNSIIAKFADVVCVSFPDTTLQSKKVIVTGNPLRKEIFEIKEKISHPANLPVLYITGGSTGSHALNEAIITAAPHLLEKYVLIHQTGENEFHDFEKAEELRGSLSKNLRDRYIVQKFVLPSQIGYVYKTADLVIGRAGANTVLELIACNKPSLLVPLPHGQRGEQLQNARLLQSLGLAEILPQSDLTQTTLAESVERMFKDIAKYQVSQAIIEKYVFPNAASRIAEEIVALYEKKKTHN